jgi:hypothetical protein
MDFWAVDAAVMALAAKDSNFYLNHVEPTCVLLGCNEARSGARCAALLALERFGKRALAEWLDKLSGTTRI